MRGEEAMKKLMISIFISVVVLAGCSTISDHQFETYINFTTGVKPFKVKLKAEGGELVILERGPNEKCTEFSSKLRKGCFIAEEGEMLELEFKLTPNSEDEKWRFTKVKICARTTKPDPDEPSECTLDADQQADFLVVANNEVALMPSDGTIDLTDFADKLRIFSVRDFNWHVGEYVYLIQACHEGTIVPANCVWMDPGGTNKGRGR